MHLGSLRAFERTWSCSLLCPKQLELLCFFRALQTSVCIHNLIDAMLILIKVLMIFFIQTFWQGAGKKRKLCVLHLNNKNKPCFLTRILDFLSPKVAALLFVNSQIGACAFAKILQCSSLLSKSVHMYMYIFKTEQGNKRVREKSNIKFLFWKDWD